MALLPPRPELAKELLDWSPGGGVLSVYLGVDPGDRGDGWRIELRDCVHEALERLSDAEHEERLGARATGEAVIDRFPEDAEPPPGRGQVGFVELTSDRGDREERWFSTQMAPRRTQAAYGRRPYVRPLVELLDDGRRVGVVAVSGERARLLEWELGQTTEVDDMEILTTGDWRERKGPRPVGRARGFTTSAGRDQHEQRLDDNKARFVHEVAARVEETRSRRGWAELLAFGEEEELAGMAESVSVTSLRRFATNILNEDRTQIDARVRELIPGLNRDREMALIERVENAMEAGGQGALGGQETAQALAEGRVAHLLIHADRDLHGLGIERAFASGGGDPGELPPGELLVESALRTGSAVTAVEDEAAERLDRHGGVAAILRY